MDPIGSWLSSRAFAFGARAAAALIALCVSAYTIAVLTGRVPVSGATLIVLTFILAIAGLLFLAPIAARWRTTKVVDRICVAISAWFLAWFWLFAPAFYMLVTVVDQLQLRWDVFGFVWEVPVFGAAYIFIVRALFRPVQRWIDNPQDASPEALRVVRARVVRFPILAALLIMSFTAIAYVSCGIQIRLLAADPIFEVVKDFLEGAFISIFLGVIYYATIRALLEPVRVRLFATGARFERSRFERSRFGITGRVLIVFASVSVGSFLLLQIVVVKTYQDNAHDAALARLDAAVARSIDDTLLGRTEGDDGGVAILAKEAVPAGDFSEETMRFIATHENGTIQDLHLTPKLVGLFADPVTGETLVAIADVDSADILASKSLVTYMLSSLFIFAVSIGVLAAVVSNMTKSLRMLAAWLRNPVSGRSEHVPQVATQDEAAELSVALEKFVTQSRELDSERTEFVVAASHQLRTPLTHLVWTIEALENSKSPEELAHCFSDLKASVARLSETTAQLLDARRIEDPQAAIKRETFDVSHEVAQHVEAYRLAAEHKELHLEFKPCDAPPLSTDKLLLGVACEALLSNAIAYTAKGGSIAVAVAASPERVAISFRDTGIGIPPGIQKRIFSRFVRAPNAKLVRPDGTGLGLYLAKHAVARIGGTISLVSKEREGSTFTITIPIRTPEGE